MEDYQKLLKTRLDKVNFNKLLALNNPYIFDFVGEYVQLCNPKTVFIRSDSLTDATYIRSKAVQNGEEVSLAVPGQTAHFDGIFDQGRDKEATKYLLSPGEDLGKYANSVDRNKGEEEIKSCLKDIMSGREMLVGFFSLCPCRSEFSVLAVQITDSPYVVHSEDILYRPGYAAFRENPCDRSFFKFVHSAGELENKVSRNYGRKKIYIDIKDKIVYSIHTQYAGNSVGLKKLALRLAIDRASSQGWLAEHMFIMGVDNGRGKLGYFCGAYPSMCGKTSTAMVKDETIIGDDIAYLRKRNGKIFAANVERGIFGIIKDVNCKDDATLFKALTCADEVIFSNILVDDDSGQAHWTGKDDKIPQCGVNYAGAWFSGKTDEKGEAVLPSHKNARYTIRLSALENVDANLENPCGVEVRGLIYGGRDSDTSVPLEQAFSWQHGIITKAASMESETTAATLGEEGVRVFNPMANMDFLSIPLGRYIEMNLAFAKDLPAPLIFSVNYFLKGKEGKFLNTMQDKRVWLRWMRLRADNEVGAYKTATGMIPKLEDLKKLFSDILSRDYCQDDYVEQFTLRIPQNLAKIERIRNIYKSFKDIPAVLFQELDEQEKRLKDCRKELGDYVSPDKLGKFYG